MKLNVPIQFKDGYTAITKTDVKAAKEKNDCFVRAWMNAFEMSYDDAHAMVKKEFGRKNKKGTMGCKSTMNRLEGRPLIDGLPTTFEKKVINGRTIKFLGNNPLIGGSGNILWNPLHPKYVYDEESDTYTKEYAGYTVGKFIQQHQYGTYIILVAKHALAVKDGVMIDNGDHNDELLNKGLRDQRRALQIFKIEKV
tara:strand:- start:219 stop:806 length:588 start_codon:yes stop_codon:yes gene_type:complete